MMTERLLKPKEVAERLGVSKHTIYNWCWEDKLKGIQIGGPNHSFRILDNVDKLNFEKPSYRPQEVADLLRISLRTVNRMIADGRLRAIQVSPGIRRVKAEEIQKCLEEI